MPRFAKPFQGVLPSSRKKGVLRARDLVRQGIHPQTVSRLVQQGKLTRAGRGRYLLSKNEPSQNIGLALAATAAPQAVVCLLSALRFHELGTQAPYEVWIAIARQNTRPRVDYPPVRVTRFSGKAFTFGIERHEVDGVRVKIYSGAKTVADCFKFRNKIGLDVALEALREGLMEKRFTRDELWRAAKVCRVTTIIRPYLEVL
jgi:predicted transcriptional regulator of viral defense system